MDLEVPSAHNISDFVRPAEAARHAELYTAMWKDLCPEGALEQALATEIIRATWRLHRCSAVEATFSDFAGDLALDPMVDPVTARTQLTVDRARAHSHGIIMRSLAELRRIQTERQSRPALIKQAIAKQVLPSPVDAASLGLASSIQLARIRTPAKRPAPITPVGRNDHCPCGSRLKFKRCCGATAPEFTPIAA